MVEEKREVWETGSQRDSQDGKPRYDLITPEYFTVLHNMQDLSFDSSLEWAKSATVEQFRLLLQEVRGVEEREVDTILSIVSHLIVVSVRYHLKQQGLTHKDALTEASILQLGHVLASGAAHYGEDNWKLGQPLSRYVASFSRHLFQYFSDKTDFPHFGAMQFNLMGIQHLCLNVLAEEDGGYWAELFNS